MSRVKAKNTTHSLRRAEQRTTFSKRESENLMKEASRYRLSWDHLDPGPLQGFVHRRSRWKRVKYYKGYIFVFNKTSTGCITMYEVPEKVLKAQEEWGRPK